MEDFENDKLDIILKKIDKIDRGLYGDADNKVPGLMQDHYEVKADVKGLKEFRKKAGWITFGFLTAIQALWFVIKEIWGK